jgi:hypothetical protein
MRIRSIGHGGAIVVLPETGVRRGAYRPRFAFHPALPALAHRYKESVVEFLARRNRSDESDAYLLTLLPDVAPLLEGDDYQPKMDEALNTVSRLSATDGAIVFDSELRVKACGAVLPVAPKMRGRGTWLEWQPGRKAWERKQGGWADLGGTRHQSALAFAVENPGAVVLVCSQDGGITMLSRPRRPRGDSVVRVARNVEQAIT